MNTATTSEEEPQTQVQQSGKTDAFRRRLGIGLVMLWVAAQTWVWFSFADDRTHQIMFTYMVTPTMAFLLLCWFLFASGLSWLLRRNVGGGLLLAVAVFLGLFRFEGFWGDMVPRFVWRLSPTHAEQLLAFREDSSSAAKADSPSTEALQIAADDWPAFRGPQGDGVARGVTLRTDWDAHPPRELWRHPVGSGWSSFAIVGTRAYTQEQIGELETVTCYDTETGRLFWSHADTASFVSAMGGNGPRATPTVFDSRVYTIGATGIVNCLDAISGKPIWQQNALTDAGATNISWGMAASPLVSENMVVVNPGGSEGRSVIAYDRLSGEILWARGDHPASYCALRREQLAGKDQLLLFDGDGLAGLDPANGQELWRRVWQNDPKVNAAQPILHDGQVLISSGYGLGSVLLDVSAPADGVPRDVWIQPNRFRLKFNDAVYRKGLVFGLDDGILSCIEAESGQRRWKRGRYGYGQLLLTDNVLLVQAEDGRVLLLEIDDKGYRELCSIQPLSAKTWNHPVLHRGRLYIRNAEEAVCLDLN